MTGPDTAGYVTAWPVSPQIWGVRFASGFAPALLGVAADEVRDQVPPLDDLMPAARVRRLTEFVEEADQRGSALEEIAAGYTDQAHMARDVRALAGTSPRALIR